MQGSSGPEGTSGDVNITCIDTEELGITELKQLLCYFPFELFWWEMPLSVQTVPVSWELHVPGLTYREEKRKNEDAFVDTHDSCFEKDVDQYHPVDEFFEERGLYLDHLAFPLPRQGFWSWGESTRRSCSRSCPEQGSARVHTKKS